MAMSFLRQGIDHVRVFTLPDGVTADGGCAAVSRAALVTWRSSHEGMFHQVYVNGRFSGATIDPQQRRLIIHVPSSFESAARVEVIAVKPKDARRDFASEIERPACGSGRVRLVLLRSQILPIGATANIYFDHGTGQVDYTAALDDSPVPVWPCVHDKAGFGMGRFGAGDFGYDAAASIGCGKGSFGDGQFGLDADTIEWLSPLLPLGKYRFGVKIVDARGNESPASETELIPVIPAARPAAKLNVAAFDPQINQLTLNVSDQV